jgi:hypothetical protein
VSQHFAEDWPPSAKPIARSRRCVDGLSSGSAETRSATEHFGRPQIEVMRSRVAASRFNSAHVSLETTTNRYAEVAVPMKEAASDENSVTRRPRASPRRPDASLCRGLKIKVWFLR